MTSIKQALSAAMENEHLRRTAQREIWRRCLPPCIGFGLLIVIWFLSTLKEDATLPGPAPTLQAAWRLFAHPLLYPERGGGECAQQIFASLRHLGAGLGIAALIGIPLGWLMGRFVFMMRMLHPLIRFLRPISPLAWLPVGLLLFKNADAGLVWIIALCALWPISLQTAQALRRVPQDHLNVARVLDLRAWRRLTCIVLPSILPQVLGGFRTALAGGWLILVAAEIAVGGNGIGSWMWRQWHMHKLDHLLVAMIALGLIGFVFEQALRHLIKRTSYPPT